MSKELEYVERMICWYEDNFSQLGKERNQEHIEQLNNIKSALQRLETIDNADINEALECLKQIEDVIETKIGLGVVNTYLINIIKQALLNTQELETMIEEYDVQPHQIREALLIYRMMSSAGYGVYHIEKAQKQEKVLKIIREKCIDNTNLDIIPSFEEYDNYYFYLKKYCVPEDASIVREKKILTEEEFYLLKRYFNEEKH